MIVGAVVFRKDGWPLCPQCDDDELWHPNPDLVAEGGLFEFRCYACAWTGYIHTKRMTRG